MELEEIEAVIERDGTVRIQVRGVKGASCLALTRPLEDALGGVVEARELTAEARDEARAQDLRRDALRRER
jgi:hypothetical protein